MNKSVYEDGKYCIQDVGTIYLGCKYTVREVLEAEDVPFKLRMLLERYLAEQADPEDTLESLLYYMEPGGFHGKVFQQVKAKVKVNVLEAKKGLLGGRNGKSYTTKLLPVSELTAMDKARKEALGLVVQELSVSKLALMGM